MGRVLAPVLAALLVRLACLPLGQVLPETGDATGYAFLAREWAQHGQFAWLREGVRPPLHRILIAPGLDDDPRPDDTWPGVFLIQIAADVAALVALMAVTRRRFGPRAAAGAGWLYALYPPAILYASGVVMVESLATLAVALALLAYDATERSMDDRPWLRASVLGAVLGTGILVKEMLLLVTVVMMVALLLRPGAAPHVRVGCAALVLGVALAVTTPWTEHNRRQHGTAILSGTFGAFATMVDNAPPDENGYELWAAEPDIRSKVRASRRVFARALFEYPGLTARRALARLRILAGPEVILPSWVAVGADRADPVPGDHFRLYREQWTLPAGTAGRVTQVLCGLGTLILMTLGVAGLAAAPRTGLGRVALLMAGALLLAVALTVAAERYRHALVPFLLPFAGLALDLLTQREPVTRAVARRSALGGVAAGSLLTATIFLLAAP